MVPHGENGQATVEMSIILLAILVVILGLLEVGLGFYQYTEVSAAASTGARFAAVVGGQCSDPTVQSSDWCNQLGTEGATNFWQQDGNRPLQPIGSCASSIAYCCPQTYDAAGSTYYYSDTNATPTQTVSYYLTHNTGATVVGAILRRFDTNAGSSSTITGARMPGFHPEQLKVCVQLGYDGTVKTWATETGDPVKVYVYYPFQPAFGILPLGNVFHVNFVASARDILS